MRATETQVMVNGVQSRQSSPVACLVTPPVGSQEPPNKNESWRPCSSICRTCLETTTQPINLRLVSLYIRARAASSPSSRCVLFSANNPRQSDITVTFLEILKEVSMCRRGPLITVQCL